MPRPTLPSGRKSLVLLLLIAVVLVGAVWWRQRPPPEPRYHGQRLSDWLTAGVVQDGDLPRSREEIRAFGPEAVPWLVYAVEHGSLSNRDRLLRTLEPLPFDNFPDGLRRWLPAKWGGLRVTGLAVERISAAQALSLLGPQASEAIPSLVKFVAHPDDDFCLSVAQALQSIGPASWPAVKDILDHGSERAREVLLSSMYERLETDGRDTSDAVMVPVVEALVKGLHDPAVKVREAAVYAIAISKRGRADDVRFDSAITPLIELLSDEDLVALTVDTLDAFETKAAPAIPRLIELRDDPDSKIRDEARQALQRLGVSLRIMLLRDPDAGRRDFAAETLRKLRLSPEEESALERIPARE